MDTPTYSALLFTLIIGTIWSILHVEVYRTWTALRFFAMMIITVIFTVTGTLFDFWKIEVNTSDSISTKVGSEIIVQSKFPTLIIDKIQFIDKPLKVTERIGYNAFGLEVTKYYTITIK